MVLDWKSIGETLDDPAPRSSQGLPEDLFLLVSRLTPIVNVDLFINDAIGRVLLTWRADEFYGPGWHVPGGIIRFQETLDARIQETARTELDAQVTYDPTPLAIREAIQPEWTIRGHFISFIYRCTLVGPPADRLRYLSGEPAAGQWSWHATCPNDMIEIHRSYAEFF